jgi:hypothetical protein
MYRAYTEDNMEERPELPPLDRNKVMVDECPTLIGMPKGMQEELHSGTWATIRYARKRKREIIIVWPNGEVTVEK